MKKSKKYEAILVKSQELFGKYGFKRVSIEEICNEAGVSKMTFYRSFDNKIQLASSVIEHIMQKSLSDFRKVLYSETSVEDKLAGILKIKAEGTKDFGEEFIKDLYTGSNPELHEIMMKKSMMMWNEITGDFKNAQKKGWFRDDFDPELLLHVSYSMIPLMTNPKILAIYENPQRVILEIAKLMTYGIAPISMHK